MISTSLAYQMYYSFQLQYCGCRWLIRLGCAVVFLVCAGIITRLLLNWMTAGETVKGFQEWQLVKYGWEWEGGSYR